ncbi:CHCHD5 [Cervus elaphus hippelaphus]|uniref:CHCHD5 n=1 Tax=Cervus elaphus hippelaphus TaxID=46360 RepID=A0A212CXT0_CEREH|nr:CHCHD5 [Cervus elaphus hippelaphus]
MRRQKVQRGLRGQVPRPSAQQPAATEPNQATNSSMLRGRSSGSRSPPAPIGRLTERSAAANSRLWRRYRDTSKYFRGIPHAARASRKQKGVKYPSLPEAEVATQGAAMTGPDGKGPSCLLCDRPKLEITARYCGRELEQYGQCVAAKPESWQRDCHHLKMSIAQCTSAHPIIRQIRQACLEPFKAFEECLRQNEAAVGNCAEHVRRFLQCAEQAHPLPAS